MISVEVTYYDVVNDVEQIKLSTGHELQFGGVGGGYCYTHQDFDCIDNLSKEEWEAIHSA